MPIDGRVAAPAERRRHDSWRLPFDGDKAYPLLRQIGEQSCRDGLSTPSLEERLHRDRKDPGQVLEVSSANACRTLSGSPALSMPCGFTRASMCSPTSSTVCGVDCHGRGSGRTGKPARVQMILKTIYENNRVTPRWATQKRTKGSESPRAKDVWTPPTTSWPICWNIAA